MGTGLHPKALLWGDCLFYCNNTTFTEIFLTDEEGFNHRHHGTGRILPYGIAA
jgi:hypothetical protein